MRRNLRSLVAPAYLLLCIILGGSAQFVWGNFALQLIGVAILVWVIARRRSVALSVKFPYLLILLTFFFIALELVPLPPEIWTRLPGRSGIASGYELLQMRLPWLPVSETPYQSATTLFALLPPLAMFAAVQASDSDRASAVALVAATAAAIVLGALQVASGSNSNWYFYAITNTGAVGFFANRNHMATLLLATIPFVAALLLSGKSQQRLRGRSAAMIMIAAAALGLILIGVALNHSLAALLLVIPVFIATALMVPAGWRLRWFGAPVVLLGLIAAIFALSLNPLNSSVMLKSKEVSVQSRQAIWHKTGEAIADTFPIGTGLGSFESVFAQYENPETVDSTYINHAHNDYLELTLELGVAGVLLLVLFISWWVVRSTQIWSSNLSSPFDRAATIASAAILAHSIVDFPLRTAAIAAVFAMCIAMISRFHRREMPSEAADSGGLRHVTIGG